MSEKETSQPVLDTLIQSRELQMLKSVVPYIQEPHQKIFSVIIKIIELQKTLQLFEGEAAMQAQELHICSSDSSTERMCGMLNAIREYCTPQEQENIDSMISAFDMFSTYELLCNQQL